MNNQRTGANLSESILNTSNVNSAQFGKLFELTVDDNIFAGILYAAAVPIAGGTHNVIYIPTVNNTIYAFDADTVGNPLWQRNFNGSGRPSRNTELGQACGSYKDFIGNIGIVGTPVIDGPAQTMYFVTRTVEGSSTVQRLRAIDITTGNDRANSPQVIQASVPGNGDGGTSVIFNAATQNQRPALSLSQGIVYIGWSSFCDTNPYHGWMMAYSGSTLAQVGVSNATPNGSQAGIWMAGAGPAFDATGNMYVATGNGTFDGTSNFGESLLKLAASSMSRLDFFTPSNFTSLNSADLDFGSGGPTLLPGTTRLVSGGKEGKLYLLDTGSLGHEVSGDTQIPQSFEAVDVTVRPSNTHHIHNANLAWNSPQGLNVYLWGENDFLRIFRYNSSTQKLDTPATAVGSVLPPVGMPGGMMFLSANGATAGSGILWAAIPSAGDANQATVPGVIHAFNAENAAHLWSSTGVNDDSLNFAKGSPPIVANGKMYAASLSSFVSVYGLRTVPPPSQNLALNKVATGSAPCASTETPAKAFNGSVSGGNSDKFCSNSAPLFLQVDLGSIMTVNRFVVEHAGAGGEDFSFNTKAFNIQTSTDGSTFTTQATVTGNIQSITTHDISPVAARFVRLNVTTPTQGTDPSARIYELRVYGSGGAAVPVTFEAESLPVAGFTTGDVERVAADVGYSGGQGVILEGNAVGDFVSFTVNVPEARTYDVRVGVKNLTNRGIWQLSTNNVNHGAPVDQFSSAAVFSEVEIGNVSFSSAGNATFTFRITGKNASSSGFWISLDYIKLIPQ